MTETQTDTQCQAYLLKIDAETRLLMEHPCTREQHDDQAHVWGPGE